MTPGEHANAIAGACGKLFGIELPVSVHAHIADAIRAAEAAAFAAGKATRCHVDLLTEAEAFARGRVAGIWEAAKVMRKWSLDEADDACLSEIEDLADFGGSPAEDGK